MNCQEVMELMQRQLDQDLDTQEERQMRAHLEQCSDCAIMFERLQLLSDELTKLPKVMPAYSLVDAILPRLSEIDRQAETTGHASVVPLASDPAEPGATAPRKLPWTRRFGSQISWKLSGGVIAAGLVIGFFIYGADPSGSNKNADGLLQSTGMAESSTAASQNTNDTAKPNAAAGNAPNSPSSDNSVILDQNGKSINNEGSELIAPSSVPSTAQEPTKKQPDIFANPASSAPKETDKSVTESDMKQDRGNEAENTTNNNVIAGPDPVKSPQEPAPSPQPQATPMPSSSTTDTVEKDKVFIQEDAAIQSSAPETEERVGKKANESDNQQEFGALTMSEEAADAPSEPLVGDNFVAVIEKQRILIRDAVSGKLVFTSAKVWADTDTIKLLSWSDDGKLTYQVNSNNQTHTFIIDLTASSETIQSP